MHRHNYILDFLKNRELNEIYATIALRSLALSMIVIFIPIYLLQLGNSLTTVFTFFLILNLARGFFMVASAKIASKFGFKHTMFFHVPFMIVTYGLFYSLENYNIPLFIPAITLAAGSSLFWMGYHLDFAKFSHKKTRGQEIGLSNISSSLFHAAGPLIGGLILYYFSFGILFTVVSLLLIISMVPLLFSKDVHEPLQISLKDIFDRKRMKRALALMGFGIESSIAVVIWPIFIFGILNSYVSLGLVSTVGLFFSLIATFVIGKFADSRRLFILRFGAIFTSLIWFIKIFVTTSLQIFLIDSLHGVTRTMKYISFDALSYDRANRRGIVSHMVFREIFIHMGRVLLYITLILTSSFIGGLLMGGGGALLMLLF
jgi:MFS family permease